ncbi:MAG: histidine kinase [Hyphomicrobiaceae bacterium]|nr:histidine kinase [Hyphomicrobiaceae bacterium]
MPTLFRFLFVSGLIAGGIFAGLYVMATRFEPEQRDVTYRIDEIQVDRRTESE